MFMPVDPKIVNYKGVMLFFGRANHNSMKVLYVKNCILQVYILLNLIKIGARALRNSFNQSIILFHS